MNECNLCHESFPIQDGHSILTTYFFCKSCYQKIQKYQCRTCNSFLYNIIIDGISLLGGTYRLNSLWVTQMLSHKLRVKYCRDKVLTRDHWVFCSKACLMSFIDSFIKIENI